MARVRNVMTQNLLMVSKTSKVADALKLLAQHSHSCVVVVDNKKPVGIITESDLIKNLLTHKIRQSEPVSKIMSSPVTSVDIDSSLERITKIIDTRHHTNYPVMDKGDIVGIVSKQAVVHEMNDNIRFHRTIQNFVLIIFVLFEFIILLAFGYL